MANGLEAEGLVPGREIFDIMGEYILYLGFTVWFLHLRLHLLFVPSIFSFRYPIQLDFPS